MIELHDICVSFRSERQEKIFGNTRIQVLFDVSLKIGRGVCLGILGESGSGKSTLGNVLCGLLKPDRGSYTLDGVPIDGRREGKRLLQSRMSVVFQDYTTSANPRFRVRDILTEGIRAWEVMDLLRELKEKLGLTYIFITHDLTSVTYLCDEVLFLYKGRVTEHIPVDRIAETKDTYARELLGSIIDFETEEREHVCV